MGKELLQNTNKEGCIEIYYFPFSYSHNKLFNVKINDESYKAKQQKII